MDITPSNSVDTQNTFKDLNVKTQNNNISKTD